MIVVGIIFVSIIYVMFHHHGSGTRTAVGQEDKVTSFLFWKVHAFKDPAGAPRERGRPDGSGKSLQGTAVDPNRDCVFHRHHLTPFMFHEFMSELK